MSTPTKSPDTPFPFSPIWKVTLIAASVFAVEVAIMLASPWLTSVPQPWNAALDASILTLVLLPVFYVALLRPLNAQVRAAKQVDESLRIRSTALEAAAHGVLITDRGGHILWCNAAFVRLTGYSADEVLGRTPQFLRSGRHDASFYEERCRRPVGGSL